MRDLAIEMAGGLAILVAVVHGVLGEIKVFARATIEPAGIRRLLRLVWHCGAIAWAGGGVLLIAAPWLQSEIARVWIVLVLAVIYGAGATANAWATRGRHVGWMLLSAVVILAVAGV